MEIVGKLTAELRTDTAAIPVEVKENNLQWTVSFKPEIEDHSYLLYLRWAGFPLPFAPLRFAAVSDFRGDTERQRVLLSGAGLKEAKCDQENVFYIDGSSANTGE